MHRTNVSPSGGLNKSGPSALAAAVVAGCVAAGAGRASAALDYAVPDSVYTQDFNGLASTGTSNPWTNDSTLPGFYIFHSGATSTAAGIKRGSPDDIDPAGWIAVNDYRTSGGSSSRVYAWGHATENPSDRALGTLTGSVSSSDPGDMFYALVFRNTTGQQLTSFTLTYTGEQWFDQLAPASGVPIGPHTLAFSHRVAETFDANADVPTRNDFGAYTRDARLDFVSPTTGNTDTSVAALNGNDPANRVTLSATVDVAWDPNAYLVLRFWDDDDNGNDQPHGIDDLSFVAVVPEPTAATAVGLLVGSMLMARRPRRRRA